MAITIQKSTSGAIFYVQNAGDIAKPFAVNDYQFIPYSDGSFTLVYKQNKAYERDGYPSDPAGCLIYKQSYANIINGDTAAPFADFATLRTYIELNFFRKPGSGAGSTSQKTGTALTFDGDAVYGTTGTPETGNITASVTGAVLMNTVLVIHNNGSAPTFDSKFKKMSGSGDYTTGQLNYIYCQYVDDTHILYNIQQTA